MKFEVRVFFFGSRVEDMGFMVYGSRFRVSG